MGIDKFLNSQEMMEKVTHEKEVSLQTMENDLQSKEVSLREKESSFHQMKQEFITLQAQNNIISSELNQIKLYHKEALHDKEELQKQVFDLQSRYQSLLLHRETMNLSIAEELNTISIKWSNKELFSVLM